MPDTDFFQRLEPIRDFAEIVKMSAYADVPREWLIVVTDVRGSTQAVEEGRYKDVNLLGAASIIAVLNATDRRDVPFVFGGDGATVLLAPAQRDGVVDALLGLAKLARRVFDLELRVGVVPVADLLEEGHDVRVARLALSPHLNLAMFWGSGFEAAERLVKRDAAGNPYALEPEASAVEPDMSGLECRWQPFRSRNGRMISLIVQTRGATEAERVTSYAEVLRSLRAIAPDLAGIEPVRRDAMRLGSTAADLDSEARLRTGAKVGARKFFHQQRALLENRVGTFLLRRQRRFAGFDGRAYPDTFVAHSDFRKFDGALRMVVDFTPEQERELRAFLDSEHEAQRIFYGMHVADAALVTCMVFDWELDHVHFVDGAEGGYALAAKQMKGQMRRADATG